MAPYAHFCFDDCIARIRSEDDLTYEDAYHELAPRAAAHVPQLIAHMRTSPDGYTRGKFVELLGDAGDRAAIPVLAEELGHPDQNVRQWAVTSLSRIGGPEAEALVAAYRAAHPDEIE